MTAKNCPIDPEAEDSTKRPGTKPLIRKQGDKPVSAEAELREQQQRRDRVKP
jgi:hypothetical protein